MKGFPPPRLVPECLSKRTGLRIQKTEDNFKRMKPHSTSTMTRNVFALPESNP